MTARSGSKGGDKVSRRTLTPGNFQCKASDPEGLSTHSVPHEALQRGLLSRTMKNVGCRRGNGLSGRPGFPRAARAGFAVWTSVAASCTMCRSHLNRSWRAGPHYSHVWGCQEAALQVGTRLPRSKSWLCHLPALYLWATCLTSLSLCEIGIVIEPTSQINRKMK